MELDFIGGGVVAAYWIVEKFTGLLWPELVPQLPGKQETTLWGASEPMKWGRCTEA